MVLQKKFTKSRNGRLMSLGLFASHATSPISTFLTDCSAPTFQREQWVRHSFLQREKLRKQIPHDPSPLDFSLEFR